MSYNLPPGCSQRDIDRHAGAYNVECPHCSEVVEACELSEDGTRCPHCQVEDAKCKGCGDRTYGVLNDEVPCCADCFEDGTVVDEQTLCPS